MVASPPSLHKAPVYSFYRSPEWAPSGLVWNEEKSPSLPGPYSPSCRLSYLAHLWYIISNCLNILNSLTSSFHVINTHTSRSDDYIYLKLWNLCTYVNDLHSNLLKLDIVEVSIGLETLELLHVKSVWVIFKISIDLSVCDGLRFYLGAVRIWNITGCVWSCWW